MKHKLPREGGGREGENSSTCKAGRAAGPAGADYLFVGFIIC